MDPDLYFTLRPVSFSNANCEMPTGLGIAGTMEIVKTECDNCGTCCMNGGPALHSADLDLIEEGQLSLDSLVTIRQCEMVYQPLGEKPEAVEKEFIKVQGRGGDWCCMFYDRLSSLCTIYRHRPLACRLLKCWDTKEILRIAGKDLLTRFDCIQETDPMFAVIRQHEKKCQIPELDVVADLLQSAGERKSVLADLTALVNTDLQMRDSAARQFNLSLGMELFYLGRPVFQLLAPLGITCTQSSAGLTLCFNSV